MTRGSQLLFVLIATVALVNFVYGQQDGTQLYQWNQVLQGEQWLLMPYMYLPFLHPTIPYNTLTVPSYDVPDLKATKKETCAPLPLTKCRREAQVCLDLAIVLRDSFSTYTSVVGCAGQNGIGIFALLAAHSPSKTNAEVLRDAGADANTARAIFRCVLTNLGYAKNNVLDVSKVKSVLRPIISQNLGKPGQQAATMAALNTCPQPHIDGIREYVICISKSCVKGR